jgi:putative transposase
VARAQRNLAGKQRSSKSRAKARLKVARVPAQIADQRRDGLHTLTTRLIREPAVICVESVAVQQLVRNQALAKAISDVGWCGLVRHLTYRAAWYRRTLIGVDEW